MQLNILSATVQASELWFQLQLLAYELWIQTQILLLKVGNGTKGTKEGTRTNRSNANQ